MPEEQREITLGLLNAVHENSNVTQRNVAQDLGVALGLVNAYLKRSVKKGFIKVRQAPANRFAYYLTPAGFAEKSRLTAAYLSHSFTFFRNARREGSEILGFCEKRNWLKVALAGTSDLAEIIILCAGESKVSLAGILDTNVSDEPFMGLPVTNLLKKLGSVDAVVITDLTDPQSAFNVLSEYFPSERILAPDILGIVRNERNGRKREAG
ncbi:MAG: winged helix-turn-helix transcriptional regulator [Rhodospirillales bacterium]|jgi:DNA-binding MarR family transcriptional regulator|nr:winged helix-turn-helix transcriptional regulator [Rhodospirillales bacterium]